MQRQSHSPNRASGLPGKIWNIVDSLGGIFGRWKEAESSEPPAKFFPLPRTYAGGLEKICHALYAKLQHH